MFGHGNWSADNDNHYFFMPYPSEPVLHSLSNTSRPLPPPSPHSESPAPLDVLSFQNTSSSNENYDYNNRGDVRNGSVIAVDTTSTSTTIPLISAATFTETMTTVVPPAESSDSEEHETSETAAKTIATRTSPTFPEQLSVQEQMSITPVGVITVIHQQQPKTDGASVVTNANGIEGTTTTDAAELSQQSMVAVPVICQNITDSLYGCINNYLPLKGGDKGPFRVHIR